MKTESRKKNEQVDLLQKNKRGVLERDITIDTYHISEVKEEVTKWNVSSSSAFTFILVGKDGNEKMRADTVVSTYKLFAKIDAMPMRKREMK
jgi:succinate dehydrogenase flavin-adding protein (antitoxin of CptAB toxin-antitoxin module)